VTDLGLESGTRSAHLPSTVEAGPAIRAFVRLALARSAADDVYVVEVLTTELVSNVVCHVGSPMVVRVIRDGSAVRVEVDDASDEPPVLLDPGAGSEHGRGLLLVDSLARDWGWTAREQGKTVWFVIDVERA
jgi:anti-sigma regulatory factor (Ser/Thr protein kinase)